MVEEEAGPVFDPRVYYHRDGRTYVCQTAGEEQRILQDGGWADSPAVYGVITAPSAEQLAHMPQVVIDMPGEERAGQMAFSHLLLQWQQKLDKAEETRVALEKTLQVQQLDASAQREETLKLTERVTAVEQWMVQQESRRAGGRTEAPASEKPQRS